MNEDIEVFFDRTEGAGYIESLIRSRVHLKDSPLLALLDEVILKELELAKLESDRAKSDLLKSSKENTVRPIK
jgi:hypothetical protein